jgi:hypothetical protein
MFVFQAQSRYRLILVLSALLGPLACTCAIAQEQSRQVDDKHQQIKALLKERRELLEGALTGLMDMYKTGLADLPTLDRATRDLLRAAIDPDEDPKIRATTLQKCQEYAETIVKVTKEKLGATTKVDVLIASALLVEVRIELLRTDKPSRPRQ